jgi:Zn-dependent peptidase ImmA (M78 family)/transcriptional regulator with XRE-family HTH domain
VAVGERLKYARERSGLTLRQVEERTGIGQSSLSEFEGGKREPRLSYLQALSDAYRRSLDFFLGNEPLPSEVVLWREQPPSPTCEEIEGEFLRLCEQYHNLEMWLDERRATQLPRAEGDPETYCYADAEALAHEVRAALSLGDRPGQNLLTTLEENCGVKVFHQPFENEGAAASCVTETFGVAVLLNANNVRWRRNFSLAHELFHLLTWPVFRKRQSESRVTADPKEEKLATCFAGNLLMPTDATRTAINKVANEDKISFADMFDIARQFDVSVEALVWRMAFLKYFNYDDAPDIISRYKAVAALWEGKRVHDDPPIRPPRFRALAIRALRQGEVSLGRFAEYLGISRREARAMMEQDARGDEEVQITTA